MSQRISNYRLRSSRAVRFRIALSLIAGGLPLLIYPGVFIGVSISLAAPWTDNEPLLTVVAKSVLIGSISYPLVYFVSLVMTLVMAKIRRTAIAFKISLVPLAYLLVLALLVAVWASLPSG
ncbi:hypothetical protein H6F95_08495 [Cyanobacteria bacterium FACHB-471]|nr:hypothetical protein [Cyanobacteria bacterium FACHB-471]